MSWQAIARKEYAEIRQSRLVRYLVYLFIFACLIGGYVFPLNTTGDITLGGFAGYMVTAVSILLPLIGLLLGYNAIVSERSAGQLALVLGMPHSRRDVVVGKLCGRGIALLGAVVIGLVGAAVLVFYPYGSVTVTSIFAYLLYIVLTLLFGVIFFGIGLTLSTLTRSKQLATLSAFAVFFVFVVIWDEIETGLLFALERLGFAHGDLPAGVVFVHQAQPIPLYDRIVAGFFEGTSMSTYFGGDAPWFLNEWAGLVLFLLWVVLPLSVGYRRFREVDL